MAAATGVIGFDIEAPQALARPVATALLHLRHLLHALHLAHDHRSAEVCEPVRAEGTQRHRLHHRVRVALLDLAVEQLAQVGAKFRRHPGRGGEGDEGCDCDAVAEGDLADGDFVGEGAEGDGVGLGA